MCVHPTRRALLCVRCTIAVKRKEQMWTGVVVVGARALPRITNTDLDPLTAPPSLPPSHILRPHTHVHTHAQIRTHTHTHTFALSTITHPPCRSTSVGDDVVVLPAITDSSLHRGSRRRGSLPQQGHYELDASIAAHAPLRSGGRRTSTNVDIHV